MTWAVGVRRPRGPGAEETLTIALAMAVGCLCCASGIAAPPTVVGEFLDHALALALVSALEAVAPV